MHHSETILPYSLEAFLSDQERWDVCAAVDSLKAVMAEHEILAGRSGRSVHSIDGLGVVETVAVYEPEGRVEIPELPNEVTAVLNAAFERRRPDIVRAYPSVRGVDCWMYVEYGVGQFITSHIDYSQNESRPDRPKVTGINVLLSDGFEGGEFYVETSGSGGLWEGPARGSHARPGANVGSEWFRLLPRTRWVASPAPGTALLYGTQLVHGTQPVRSGRVRKVIGFLGS